MYTLYGVGAEDSIYIAYIFIMCKQYIYVYIYIGARNAQPGVSRVLYSVGAEYIYIYIYIYTIYIYAP